MSPGLALITFSSGNIPFFSNLPFISRLMHKIRPQEFFGGLLHTGGLWHTTQSKPGKQEEILLKQIYKLMCAISNTTTPVTLMRYPRIVKDCIYLFGKLKPVLKNVDYDPFCSTFYKVVRPELIHSFNKNDC